MKNYYDELEVSRNASPEIINRAYKVLAKKYHPDITTENKQEAEERFKKISEAYETLSDEQKRMEYDNSLQPEINIDDYNKILADNKRLATELLNLKSQIDHLNSSQNTTSNEHTNDHYYHSNMNNTYYTNQNQNPNINNNHQTVYNRVVYTRPQNTNSYSFIDMIKFKLNQLFKDFLAIVLTVALIFIIFSVLLYIPYTKNFILNDLHFGIFLN